MGLEKYWEKRDFKKTDEPLGKKRSGSQKHLQFVVQEHHASHHHYDFRLELDGVLKSWAVPKGPPTENNEKRLAIQVEDHPFDYIHFEGTIPKGNYGAGTVKIWDKGHYQAEEADSKEESEKQIRKGLREGHLNIILHGKKLKGIYSLVRMKTQDNKKEWLLIKKKSALPQPEFIQPMLATLKESPFDSDEWLFEIKWDGYRAIGIVEKAAVHLYSRNEQSFHSHFPPILEDLSKIKQNVILDGEVVVLDKKGIPSFQLLQNYQRNDEGQLVYMVFDILYLNGEDLMKTPLIERKKILKEILPETSHLHYCDHVLGKGKAFFDVALKAGMEGIIAKKMNSFYQPGTRGRDWFKIKTHSRQEAIICGFTEPKGTREKFGSLILGVYDQNKLRYAGHAGTGFDSLKLNRIYKKLSTLIQKKCPFSNIPKLSNATWVKPKLVCEVKFAEWTKDGIMRQPVFIELRDDKKSEEVMKEIPVEESSNEVKLTHLDKIFWPKEGYTKGDLIEYYRSVASFILPYLKERPESLHRFPNGIDQSPFFQKNVKHEPEWIRTVEIENSEKTIRYLIIDDERSLLYAINLGCIELNPFMSRVQSLQYPDYLVIDLDPLDIEFDQVIEVAKGFHHFCKKFNIPSYCKTSGATGLHIYIPTEARYSYEEVRLFGSLLAYHVNQLLPDITSLERSPSKRKKKVYLDILQNNFGQTIASPYSVRPVEGALVSTPLKWSEVKKGLDPSQFNLKTALKRFKKVGDLFKPVLEKGIDIKRILSAFTLLR